MGANSIEIYRKNSATIVCTVTGLDDLVGYTGTLTAKENKDDTTPAITKAGAIVGLVITFTLLPADTDVDPRVYDYDIVIVSTTNEYTIVQDLLEVKKSVKN